MSQLRMLMGNLKQWFLKVRNGRVKKGVGVSGGCSHFNSPSLKLTAKTPENRPGLEDDSPSPCHFPSYLDRCNLSVHCVWSLARVKTSGSWEGPEICGCHCVNCPNDLIISFEARWWFQRFVFSPRSLGKWSNLTSIFFKWVETTNQEVFHPKKTNMGLEHVWVSKFGIFSLRAAISGSICLFLGVYLWFFLGFYATSLFQNDFVKDFFQIFQELLEKVVCLGPSSSPGESKESKRFYRSMYVQLSPSQCRTFLSFWGRTQYIYIYTLNYSGSRMVGLGDKPS